MFHEANKNNPHTNSSLENDSINKQYLDLFLLTRHDSKKHRGCGEGDLAVLVRVRPGVAPRGRPTARAPGMMPPPEEPPRAPLQAPTPEEPHPREPPLDPPRNHPH
jgi:hypothetical protein